MALIPLEDEDLEFLMGPTRKQFILEDTKKSILKNHTLEEISVRHGISKRILNKWLMSLGEEHQELRQLCIDNILIEATEEINNIVKDFPSRDQTQSRNLRAFDIASHGN
ncbi:MAG: hypothetical protein E2O82_03085 [Betaproteobacteria bacterium]|nr:MAG: hypothetical protein E2O82_03085 [Betaproteobacteria bacterium]